MLDALEFRLESSGQWIQNSERRVLEIERFEPINRACRDL